MQDAGKRLKKGAFGSAQNGKNRHFSFSGNIEAYLFPIKQHDIPVMKIAIGMGDRKKHGANGVERFGPDEFKQAAMLQPEGDQRSLRRRRSKFLPNGFRQAVFAQGRRCNSQIPPAVLVLRMEGHRFFAIIQHLFPLPSPLVHSSQEQKRRQPIRFQPDAQLEQLYGMVYVVPGIVADGLFIPLACFIGGRLFHYR